MKWLPANTNKPPHQIAKSHLISKRVLVWVVDFEGDDRGFSFATYNHQIDHWDIEDYKGSFRVKAFMNIIPPKF